MGAKVVDNWSARFVVGDGETGEAVSVVSDGLDHVYTLSMLHSGQYASMVMVAYSAGGAELWRALYFEKEKHIQGKPKLILGRDGGVYMTAILEESEGRYNYVCVKVGEGGAVLMAVGRLGALGPFGEFGCDVDEAGSVFMCFVSQDSPAEGRNFETTKFSSSGQREWTSRYNSPISGSDLPVALASDGRGNVYVTGGSLGSSWFREITTIKYSSTGAELWVARRTSDLDENGLDIARVGEGRVAMLADSYRTIMYDENGEQLWSSLAVEGGRVGRDRVIRVDRGSNLYVAGGWLDDVGGSMGGYLIIKYSEDGTELWRRNTAEIMPSGKRSVLGGMDLDQNGNVYLTGNVGTFKYDRNGNHLWFDSDAGASVSVGSCGQCYVVGGAESEIVTQCFVSSQNVDVFRHGDSNGDGKFDIGDVCAMVRMLTGGAPVECGNGADIDGDGQVSVSDAIDGMKILFGGMAPLLGAFDACGCSESIDNVSCEVVTGCH